MFTDLSNKLDDDTYLKLLSRVILMPLYAVIVLGSLAQIIG